MKATIPIGVPPNMRVMHIERASANRDFIEMPDGELRGSIFEEGYYRLWIHRSVSDRLYGTFLALYDNGKIERVTVRENEGDQVDLIKPED